MRDKQEVEIVDFLLQVKDCVVSNSPTSAAIWVAIFPFFLPLFCCPITFSFLPQLLYALPLSLSPFCLTLASSSLPPSLPPSLLQSRATKQYPSVPPQTLHTLQSQIKTIISRLPEDLQSCLKSLFTSSP